MLCSTFFLDRKVLIEKTAFDANFMPYHESDTSVHWMSAIHVVSVQAMLCRKFWLRQEDEHRLCLLVSSSCYCILSIPVDAFHFIPTFTTKYIST